MSSEHSSIQVFSEVFEARFEEQIASRQPNVVEAVQNDALRTDLQSVGSVIGAILFSNRNNKGTDALGMDVFVRGEAEGELPKIDCIADVAVYRAEPVKNNQLLVRFREGEISERDSGRILFTQDYGVATLNYPGPKNVD